jgi:flagellar hook-associated protein 2
VRADEAMGRIQTDIGLITGIPIGETVDKLMQIAARPCDMLAARTEGLKEEQVALTELSALLASVEYIANNLGKEDLYQQKTVTSSNPDALSAKLSGDPPLGTYQFTPIRTVQYQQLLSSGFTSNTNPLGGGELTFRFGDHVQRSIDLSALGGGQGVAGGAIRVTDRSGASAQIDLSVARTVDDVLEAISGNAAINVTATVSGDRIRLLDHTGQTVSNLKVEEVGGGTTAASLGLAGIDAAGNVADGQDMLWLSEKTALDLLNDGSGLFADRVFDDIAYELRDGTTGVIDLSPIIPGGSQVDEETTLGELLEVVNAAEPGKLKLEIAPDGDRLILTDLTQGVGTFAVQSLHDSTALDDLGLSGQAVDGVITGRRVLAGLKTVLLSSLGGGQSLGELGGLTLTDRSGATDTVDLSGAESLDEVIRLINAARVGILARVNQARNGIELVDTTGASSGNLIVANADATATADKLQVAVDAAVTSVNSGDLHLQIIAQNTLLDDLNGGAGVARGTLTIYDTSGQSDQLSLTSEGIQTVGDVIRAINRLDVQVLAELNETGDGIRIRDLAHGSGSLQVVEGSSTTAADLHLLGGAVNVEIDGQTTRVIDGSTTYTIELDEGDSLEDLTRMINDLDAGLQAMTFFDGSATPYRLALQSQRPGTAGQWLLDTSAIDLSLQETVPAQDALVAFGQPGAGANVLISSSSNTFDEVIPGVRLEIKQPSQTPVTVSVDKTDTNLVASVKTLVDNYNRFRDRLAELTRYDPETNTGSILTGDPTALRLDMDLPYLLSGRFVGAGSIQSLRELGIILKDDGTLEFDESKLRARLAEDPAAVQRFFADEQNGLSARFGGLVERLSAEDHSLLGERLKALREKIEQNREKIAFLNARLDAQRERLYWQFYRMELVVGKLQASLSALEQIQPLAPLVLRNKQ